MSVYEKMEMNFLTLQLLILTLSFGPFTQSTFMGKNEKPISVTVIEDTRAKLPCNISPNKTKGKVSTILWYKGTIGEPIFTYDSRSGGEGNATIWTDEDVGFGTRAVFDINAYPEALLLVDVIKVDESGMYRCRVDFHKSQTRNTFINLTVIVPPPKPRIIDEHGKPVGHILDNLEEGSSLMLICISRGGHPPPSLVWKDLSLPQDTQLIDDGFEVVESSIQINGGGNGSNSIPRRMITVHNTFQIRVLTRAALGKTFQCVAKNNNLTMSSKLNVTINMLLLPVNVTILKPDEAFSINRETLLKCVSHGSRPPATLTWWKRGKFIGQSPTKVINAGNSTYSLSTILLKPKAGDHGKDITCRSENTNMLGSAIQSDLRLNVQYPPKISLTLGKNLIIDMISQGNDVYLECLIKSNPPVYKISWYQNGRRLSDYKTKDFHIASGGKNLVIQGVRQSHQGNYTCTAYNIEGSETSEPITLNVRYKPECVSSTIKVIGVVQHKLSKIPCEFTSYPEVDSYRWTFNNTKGNFQSLRDFQFSSHNSSRSVLSYQANSSKDFGILHCYAANSEGEGLNPCVFKLIPAGAPQAPLDCGVRNHTTTGLGVICQIGFDGGLSQVFHLEVTDQETGDLLQNNTRTEPSFNIRGFETSRSILLKLYSSNSYGRSLTSVQLETTPSKVAELQIESPSSDSSQEIMGVVLGVIGTIVFLLLLTTILIFSCSKKRRRRGDSHQDRGARQSCLQGSEDASDSNSFIEVPDGISNTNNARVVIRKVNHSLKEQSSDFGGGNLHGGNRPGYSQESLLSGSVLGSYNLDERPPPPKVIFNSTSSNLRLKQRENKIELATTACREVQR